MQQPPNCGKLKSLACKYCKIFTILNTSDHCSVWSVSFSLICTSPTLVHMITHTFIRIAVFQEIRSTQCSDTASVIGTLSCSWLSTILFHQQQPCLPLTAFHKVPLPGHCHTSPRSRVKGLVSLLQALAYYSNNTFLSLLRFIVLCVTHHILCHISGYCYTCSSNRL